MIASLSNPGGKTSKFSSFNNDARIKLIGCERIERRCLFVRLNPSSTFAVILARDLDGKYGSRDGIAFISLSSKPVSSPTATPASSLLAFLPSYLVVVENDKTMMYMSLDEDVNDVETNT